MKRIIVFILMIFFAGQIFITAQENRLVSEQLDNQGKVYDRQILELNSSIQKKISETGILTNENIKVLPYQTQFRVGPDREKPQYLEIIKHTYIRSSQFGRDYIGVEEKTLRIHTDGNNVSKVETIVLTKNYNSLEEEIVTVVDPSPMTEDTDDITFTHEVNKKKLVEEKKLGDIKNTLAQPLRNEIKMQFIVPNLSILLNSIVFISEASQKGFGDSDDIMLDFLKKSTLY
ncbi:MAG: hypothetical protein WDA74_07535 [Spirochaetota bacterium]